MNELFSVKPKVVKLTGLRISAGLGLLSGAITAAPAQAVPAGPPAAPVAAASTPAGTPGTLARPGEVQGPYKAYLYQRYAADKDARAIVHLFGRKQTGGILWLLGGTSFITYLASQTGTHSSGSGTYTFTVSPIGYGIFVGLTLGIGGRKLIRFSNQNLYEALLAHEQSGSLPYYVENKLKDKDYK